jgi:hypothetical protein
MGQTAMLKYYTLPRTKLVKKFVEKYKNSQYLATFPMDDHSIHPLSAHYGQKLLRMVIAVWLDGYEPPTL